MQKLRVLDLFSGIGGFSLGLERTGGFETVAFCEINPYCRQVLARHWPDVPIHDDIKELTGDAVGHVDVVVGGFPCQPFSLAGERRGTDDDRHLWPEMLRVIRECEPAWVVGENIAGLNSMVKHSGQPEMESRIGGRFAEGIDYTSVATRQEDMLLHDICEDLDRIGFEVLPFVIPACAVDAPHRRDRLWIVANARCGRRRRSTRGQVEQPWGTEAECSGEAMANTEPDGPQRPLPADGSPPPMRRRPAQSCHKNTTPDANSRNEHGRGGTVQMGRERGAGEVEEDGFERGAQWRAEPGMGRVAHGVPDRVDRLCGLGNAVVPDLPETIGDAIMTAEHEWSGSSETKGTKE